MSIEEEINRQREKAYQAISTDPAKAANQLLQSLDALTAFAAMLGWPEDKLDRMSTEMIVEHHGLYKARVEEELLQSQKATNEALTAALGMRKNG